MRKITLIFALALAGCANPYIGEYPKTEPDLYMVDGSPCWYVDVSVSQGVASFRCQRIAEAVDK